MGSLSPEHIRASSPPPGVAGGCRGGPGGLLRARGASETVLVKEVDEIDALGALGDFSLMRKSRKLGLSVSLSRALSFSLSLSVSFPLSMCTYANVFLEHLTLEQETFQLPQAQGAQIFRNLHARRRRRSENSVSWASVPSLRTAAGHTILPREARNPVT